MSILTKSERTRLIVALCALVFILALPHHLWVMPLDDIAAMQMSAWYAPACVFGIAAGVAASSSLGERLSSSPVLTWFVAGGAGLLSLLSSVAAVSDLASVLMAERLMSFRLDPIIILISCVIGAALASYTMADACRLLAQASEITDALDRRCCHGVDLTCVLISFALCLLATVVFIDGWILGYDPVILLACGFSVSLASVAAICLLLLWMRRNGISTLSCAGSVSFGALCAFMVLQTMGISPWSARELVCFLMVSLCALFATLFIVRIADARSLDNARGRSTDCPAVLASGLSDKQLMARLEGFGLSKNEMASVLGCLDGLSSAEVAHKLKVKSATVRTYMQRAYRKVGVSSLHELKRLVGGQAMPEDGGMDVTASEHAAERRHGAATILLNGLFPVAGLCAGAVLFYLLLLSPLTCTKGVMDVPTYGCALGLISFALYPVESKRSTWRYATYVLMYLLIVPAIVRVGFSVVDPYHDVLPSSHIWDAFIYGALGRFSPMIVRAYWSTYSLRRHEYQDTTFVHGGLLAAVACMVSSFSYWTWVLVASAAFVLSAACTVALLLSGAPVSRHGIADLSEGVTSARTGMMSCMLLLIIAMVGFAWVDLWSASIAYLAPWLPFLFLLAGIIGSYLLVSRVVGRDGLLKVSLASFLLAASSLVATPTYSYSNKGTGALLFALIAWMMVVIWEYRVPLRRYLSPREAVAALGCSMFLAQVVDDLSYVNSMFRSLYSAPWIAFEFGQFASTRTAPFVLFAVTACVAIAFVCRKMPMPTADQFWVPDDSKTDASVLRNRYGLTETEASVLMEIAHGLTGDEIARKLAYSKGTVNTARRNGYRKLDIHRKEQLIALLAQISQK